MVGKPTYWVEERVEKLKKFWINDKLTSTEIAERFGCSRNSVMGALDRAGLLGSRKVREITETDHKLMEQLGTGDCRFPIGGTKPFLFCGTSTSFEDLPYCDEHMKKAYLSDTSLNYKRMRKNMSRRKKKTIDQGAKVD